MTGNNIFDWSKSKIQNSMCPGFNCLTVSGVLKKINSTELILELILDKMAGVRP